MEPAAKTSRKFRMPWIRIALVVFLIGVAAMVKYTSWYVWVPVLVVGVMSLGWLIPYLIKRAFLSGFKAKGKVLADANVTVHATKPTKPPAVDPAEQTENAEDSTANYRWFILDVTITPQEQKGPFGLWEPGELQVVGPDVTRKQMNKDLDIETAGDIAEIRILDPELKKFVRDEGGKYPGSQRLRCRVGVKPDVYQVQLRYYFELFGRIDFP
jgi:hypothetical protein